MEEATVYGLPFQLYIPVAQFFIYPSILFLVSLCGSCCCLPSEMVQPSCS